MGRFGWTAGHSKQGSDGSRYLPHEWFSKTTAEPSRQALDQLRKEMEDGGEMSPTTSPKSRSRSGTVSSTLSFYAKSSSDNSYDGATRPSSRQSVALDSGRTENAARSFFSKGSRLIRRQGSKLTLGPSQVENGLIASGFLDSDEVSVPKRGSSSKSSSHGAMPSLSPRGADIKANISGPFGFQHVSHTDQGHFQNLSKVSKLDLVQEFTAVQEGQEPATQVRGIAVGDLPPTTETSAGSGVSRPMSPTSSVVPDLPLTPPRPSPPPKDSPHQQVRTPDIRLSRSMENFSRPTRSPIAPRFEIAPIPESSAHLMDTSPASVLQATPQSPSGWAEETVGVLANVTAVRRESTTSSQVLDKPLPLPPAVVHAVSTNDESALPLRNSPLPDLPPPPTTAELSAPASVKEGLVQRMPVAHRVSLRHAQSFPTTKLLRRRSQSSGDIPFASSFVTPLPVTIQPNKTKRISIGLKKIDIADWEDAIDYAWDHELDLESVGVPAFDPAPIPAQTPTTRPESFLVVHQPPSETSTQPSTPLMMQGPAPTKPLPTPDPSKRRSSFGRLSSKGSLSGLGIGSDGPKCEGVDQNAHLDRARKRESTIMPHSFSSVPTIRREPGSPISKSSSQESIILSIASSILGTHRSSNSSTSLGDLTNLASIEDENDCESSRNVVQQDNITPPGSALVRPSDDSSRSGHTSDGSQDTVKTDCVPAAPTHAPPPPPSEPSPLSPKRHTRTTSIPRAHIPNRTSSIAAPSKGPATRARSNTLTNRPRYNPSRASYSLFPNAQPSTTSTTPAP